MRGHILSLTMPRRDSGFATARAELSHRGKAGCPDDHRVVTSDFWENAVSRRKTKTGPPKHPSSITSQLWMLRSLAPPTPTS